MTLRVSDAENRTEYDNGIDPATQPLFAKSPAYRLLLRELKRYLAQDIRGRSFLISGHRGSGKTTLVLRAIDDLIRNEAVVDQQLQRPLLVKLHGPTILAQSARVSGIDAEKADNDGEDADAREERAGDKAAQAVLIQIITALYRSLCTELTERYRARAQEFAWHTGSSEALELVGQLCLELDNAPEPALLREFWSRIDALNTGVLWGISPDMRGDYARYGDNGIRELVAASTAAQAYRVVSGSVTYETGKSGSTDRETTTTSETKPVAKEIANPILSVLSGGLVGGAAYLGEGQSIGFAALAALATLLVTSFTLSWTSKRTSKRTETREYTFIRDFNVETLDRELPTVIARIREAGLAPVFVIDELDKVERLKDSMSQLVERLKHLVADNHFFCFLTDRDYFEELRNLSQSAAYPKEHTYFSHRLFVLYRPDDLREYLNQLIRIEHESRIGASGVADFEEFRRLALTYLLMHRSMLHTFDLQRELAKICDDTGRVLISTGQLQTYLGYRYQMMIQMAIEVLLAEDELRDRLEQDAQFGQVAYDALYMPSRSWLAGDEELDISDDAIEGYLHRRLRPPTAPSHATGDAGHPDRTEASDDETAGAPPSGNGSVPTDRNAGILSGLVRDTDRKYLIRLVHRLVEMLEHPPSIVAQITESGIRDARTAALVETVPGGSEASSQAPDSASAPGKNEFRLLERKNGEPFRYQWCRDPFGRQLLHGDADEASLVDLPRQLADEAFVGWFQTFTENFADSGFTLGDLAAMGVIPRTPDWAYVVDGREHLKRYRETRQTYEDLLAHQDALSEYADMLISHSDQIAEALIAGYLVGLEAGKDDETERSRNGLRALSQLLELPALDRQQAGERLRAFCAANDILHGDMPAVTRDSQEAWIDFVGQQRTAIGSIAPAGLKKHIDNAWEIWHQQLRDYFAHDTFTPAHALSQAVCLAAGVGPGTWSVKPPSQLTIREASGVLIEALKGLGPDSDDSVPFSIALPMIRYLNILNQPDRVQSFFRRLQKASELSTPGRKAVSDEVSRISGWFAADGGKESSASASERSTALILYSNDAGAADSWLPSARYGSLLVSMSELPVEGGRAAMPVFHLVDEIGFRVVMLDIHNVEPEAAGDVLERGLISVGPNLELLPTVFLSPHADKLARTYPNLPFVEAGDFDRAMAHSISLLEQTSTLAPQGQRTAAKAEKKPAKKKTRKKSTKKAARRR